MKKPSVACMEVALAKTVLIQYIALLALHKDSNKTPQVWSISPTAVAAVPESYFIFFRLEKKSNQIHKKTTS